MRRLSVLVVFITFALIPVASFGQEMTKSQSAAEANIEQVIKLNEQLMAAEVQPDVTFVDGILAGD